MNTVCFIPTLGLLYPIDIDIRFTQTDPPSMLSIIAAVSKNRVIGLDNDLPWRLPNDFKYFKATTLGKPCLMARRTFDSLGGVLKGRTNIVLTTQQNFEAEGAIVVHSIEQGIAVANEHLGDTKEIMVLGGATLYEQILPIVDRLYLTEIDAEFEGDTFFPKFDRSLFCETSRRLHEVDDRHAHQFSFVVYDRVPTDKNQTAS